MSNFDDLQQQLKMQMADINLWKLDADARRFKCSQEDACMEKTNTHPINFIDHHTAFYIYNHILALKKIKRK